jgi:hypothetical protein
VVELEDGTIYFVHVDLEKEKVIRISPPICKINRRLELKMEEGREMEATSKYLCAPIIMMYIGLGVTIATAVSIHANKSRSCNTLDNRRRICRFYVRSNLL